MIRITKLSRVVFAKLIKPLIKVASAVLLLMFCFLLVFIFLLG